MPRFTGGVSSIGAQYLGGSEASAHAAYETALKEVNVLRLQENVRNSLQINIAGAGGGFAYSAARTVVDMVDMNGDGLLDRVMKQSGQNMWVQFNHGSGFTEPREWVVPSWADAGVDIDNGAFLGLGLGNNNTLGFSQTRAKATSYGHRIPIPVPIPLFPFCLSLEPSFGGDWRVANDQMTLMDINGDGAADQVFKKDDLTELSMNNDSNVWVKLNPAAGADLLTRVDNPLGGSFDIDYARAGNEVDRSRETDDPDNHWVMSAVTMHYSPTGALGWNADPDQRTSFTYERGRYSRDDREFLGFGTVTTTAADGSKVEDKYLTTDVYRKGLLSRRVRSDRSGAIFDVLNMTYDLQHTVPRWGLTGREAKFFSRVVTTSKVFEGTTVYPESGNPNVRNSETRRFETQNAQFIGALVLYQNSGESGSQSDDVDYSIEYYRDIDQVLHHYIVKPRRVIARNGSTTLRDVNATYRSQHGELETISDAIIGGTNPGNLSTPTDDTAYTGSLSLTRTFGYDNYGNVISYTEPRAASEAVAYKIEVTAVDPFMHFYPESMKDSFDLTWSQRNDPRTGATTRIEDVNHHVLFWQQDLHMRLNNLAHFWSNGPSQVMWIADYFPAGAQPASTKVRHQSNDVPEVLSRTFVDGWGRAIQTHKSAVVDDDGSGNPETGIIGLRARRV